MKLNKRRSDPKAEATEEEEVDEVADEEADEEEEAVGEEVAEMEAEPSSGAKRQSLIVTMRTTNPQQRLPKQKMDLSQKRHTQIFFLFF